MKNKADKIYYFLSRPKFWWAKFKTLFFYKLFFGKIGSGSLIVKPELISNPSHVFIGKSTIIHSNARILCITNYRGKIFNPQLKIGDGVKIQQDVHISCAEKIEIGNNVAIAQHVGIFDIEHDFSDTSRPIYEQALITKPISIGENSFIGIGAVIMKGSKIGKNCIVGANAVVKGEFPDYCVIAGVPAKIIKMIKNNYQK